MKLVVLATPHTADKHTPELALKGRLIRTARPVFVVTVTVAQRATAMRTHVYSNQGAGRSGSGASKRIVSLASKNSVAHAIIEVQSITIRRHYANFTKIRYYRGYKPVR